MPETAQNRLFGLGIGSRSATNSAPGSLLKHDSTLWQICHKVPNSLHSGFVPREIVTHPPCIVIFRAMTLQNQAPHAARIATHRACTSRAIAALL